MNDPLPLPDIILRVVGRTAALLISTALVVLIAVNIASAFPETENATRFARGVVSVYLLMLWFPSTRWKE